MRNLDTYKKTSNAGFTLLELVIVILLISIIISIVVVMTQESREQSRNTTVISQVYEYEKALELTFADTGVFPDTPYNRTGILCLGDTPEVRLTCLDGVTSEGIPVRSQPNGVAAETVRDAIRTYMVTQPHIQQPKSGHDFSSPAYSGCVDYINPDEPANSTTRQCSNSDFSLWFVLQGTNQDCARADLVDATFEGVYTLCRLQH